MNEIINIKCWCGNDELLPFSPEYLRCDKCETLISMRGLSQEEVIVSDDNVDFYGRKYWESHQTQDFEYPDIYTRSRTDLTERSLYWLQTVLKYKLPPANILELGSAHGGFVALLNQAEYDAKGLELSSHIVNYAKSTFGVSTYCGPVESQDIAESSLDVIILLDVIEHLHAPESTMRYCLNLLKPDGIIIIQCPHYVEGKNYQSMKEENDSFLYQLKAEEHYNLFSKKSIQLLFERLGVQSLEYEQAIFSHYDMFFVAGKTTLNKNTMENIERSLESTPNGRFTQAMIDMYKHNQKIAQELKATQHECDERLKIVNKLNEQLAVSEKDRQERLIIINKLNEQLDI